MSGRQSFGVRAFGMGSFGKSAFGAWAVALAFAAGGCNKTVSIMDVANEPVANTPQEVIEAEGCKVDVTEDEARVFSDKLLLALKDRRLDELASMVDYGVMAKLATRGTSNRQAAQGFRQGFTTGLASNKGGLFEGSLNQNATYRRLRITGNTRGRNVMVRVLAEEGGINYLDLAIVRSKDGKPVIIDAYIHAIGENFSDTLRRFFLLNGGDPSAALSVKASEADATRGVTIMKTMADNFRTGRFNEVLSEYQRLPDAFKQERLCLALQMQAAGQVSDVEYRRAMGEIRKYHGDAPWANLMLLDDDILREDYDGALRRIDRTDREVGGDPYLEVMRAGMFSEKKDYPSAVAAAERCVKAEPGLVEGHNAVLNMSLPAKRFDLVRRELLVLEKQFRQNVDSMVEADELEGFRESDQYEGWKTDRKKL